MLTTEAPEETDITTMIGLHVPVVQTALEGRVLKEKEEVGIYVPRPAHSTTNGPIVDVRTQATAETPELPFVTEKVEEEEIGTESTPVAETSSVGSETPFDVTTAEDSLSSSEASITAESTDLAPTVSKVFADTSIATTTSAAATTTTVDEDAAPFDQDKLSGLFEQDGSFIPDHLINQTTTESFMSDSNPATVVVEIDDTTPSPADTTTTSARPRPAIVIQPIVAKTTINEFHVMGRQPELDSEEARRLAAVIQEGTKAMPSPTDSKATFTMRITSIEFMEEFEDKASGKFKKLSDQIIPQMSAILKAILGENFVGCEIASLAKGSVIVNGVIMTREDIQDAEDLATKIETAISSNGSMIGQNEVDLRSINVNGIPSRAYIERVHSAVPQSSSPSALLIGSIIAVGVLVILIVAFVVIAMNNRRTNGSMKLKADELPRMESGKAAYANPQAVTVNL
ncbi:SEA domain protein [Teladorsagia circumcincta]|uniref:SEA domain protein n=1 Tax=Teladorsagia circumcincta TaxID=45464 RepID=A0A2G9UX89_TELCI|nr:SEA domain protein [Teladorsagia circumcincta]